METLLTSSHLKKAVECQLSESVKKGQIFGISFITIVSKEHLLNICKIQEVYMYQECHYWVCHLTCI